jgi:hypothetical protein
MEEPDLKPFFRLLGAQLRGQRMRLGFTQEDMIGHGFSARHWQQVEAGRPITLKTLVRACAAFDLLPSVILRATEQKLPGEASRGRRSSRLDRALPRSRSKG